AHTIAEQQIEQFLGRLDRMAVEFQKDVAYEHTRRGGRTAARHADDEQRVLATVLALLAFRQRDRLPREPEVAAFQAAVLEHGRRSLPYDRRGNDDAEAADRGGGGDPDQPAGRVEEPAAGEAVVHLRRGANHLVDGAAPPGRERPADNGDDACAGGDDVAPGSRDGEGEVSDSGTRGGRRDR